MKRVCLSFAIFFLILPVSPMEAAVIWQADFFQFRYAVDENGGIFYYPPAFYLIPGHHEKSVYHHDPTQGLFAPYDAIASGNLVEFGPVPGEIQMNAMARGPDDGINPPGGLNVNVYAEIIPIDLGDSHGVDVSQRVISWISRRFTVDSDGFYAIETYLDGQVDFAAFYEGNSHYASYSVQATVSLEQMVVDITGQIIDIQTVDGFPLDLDVVIRDRRIDVPLSARNSLQQPLTYQLKIKLALETNVVNFNLQSRVVEAALAGPFQLANADAPFVLSASVRALSDLDGDGDVDGEDLAVFAAYYFTGDLRADFSGDGQVNAQDLELFSADFGHGGQL